MDDNDHNSKQPDSVSAVLRVFSILTALGERKDTRISELSLRLAMPKATVYRFLQTMQSLGFVRQDIESERYGLTMKVFELGSKALQHLDLISLAKRRMDVLSDKTSETIHLGVLMDNEVIYIHKIDAKYSIGMYSKIGKRAPIHATAMGKALLAWEAPERRDAIISEIAFTRFRETSISSPAQFLEELARTRQQKYGLDYEEFEKHMVCIAAPVFDHLNSVVAALSITFAEFRFDPAKQGDYAKMVIDAGRAVSQDLGCSSYPLDET
ncbi:MAG: DNA-binding transcriptional regulator KdgR [Candidatus Competibacter sp.]